MVIKAHNLKHLQTILMIGEDLIEYCGKAAVCGYQGISHLEWDDEVVARLSVIGRVAGWLSPNFRQETQRVMPWGFVRGLHCFSNIADNPDNRCIIWAMVDNEIRLLTDYCRQWLRVLYTDGIPYMQSEGEQEDSDGSKN